MSTPLPPEGTELLAQEIREEVDRLAHHPIEEVKRLEHVAADGESASTPLIATTGIFLFVGVIFGIVVTAVMIVYYAA
jgi:predicted DNA repair protein MutK